MDKFLESLLRRVPWRNNASDDKNQAETPENSRAAKNEGGLAEQLSHVYAWGCPVDGRLGVPNYEAGPSRVYTPLQVDFDTLSAEEYIIHVSAGRRHTACLTNSGRLFTWGMNQTGELGRKGNPDIPGEVHKPAGMATFNGVACGEAFTVIHGILHSGHHAVFVVGDSRFQKGISCDRPRIFSGPVLQVGASGAHFLVLTQDEGIYAYGGSSNGQLGMSPTLTGTFMERLVRIEGDIALHKIVQIAVGGYHNLALTDQGAVFSWGGNSYGQLGNGTTNHHNHVPTPIKFLLQQKIQATFVACGSSHSIVISSNGDMYAFGRNVGGQCGPPECTQLIEPRKFTPETKDERFVYATAGFCCTKAISSTGRIFNYGQLWNADSSSEDMSPLIKRCVHQVWSGHYHAVALVGDMPKIFQAPSTFAFDLHRAYSNESGTKLADLQVKIEGNSTHSWQVHKSIVRAVGMRLPGPADDANILMLPEHTEPEAVENIIRWIYQFYSSIPIAMLPKLEAVASSLGIQALAEQITATRAKIGHRATPSSSTSAAAKDPKPTEDQIDSVWIKMGEKTRVEAFWSLLVSKADSDVTIQMADETGELIEFFLHKVILTHRSAKFEGMLGGEFLESKQRQINLTAASQSGGASYSKQALASFFEYLYTDNVALSGDIVLEVLALASEYMVQPLFTKCEEFIVENITQEAVCDLLREADLYQAPQLRKACLFFLRAKFGPCDLSAVPGSESLTGPLRDEAAEYVKTAL